MSGVTLGPNGLPTDPAVLRAWLSDVSTAYHELATGKKVAVVSYSQGAGSKSVTYTRANLAALSAYRAQLLAALGTPVRRAQGFKF